MDNRYIGIFDSGLGGLTAVREFMKIMPDENIIYFGDTARVPYGSKSRDVLCSYVRDDIEFLLRHDVKLILSACGTASSVALPSLAGDYPLPILGVIESAAREAAELTKNSKIGVLGTSGTISSGKFDVAIKTFLPTARVTAQACPMFVPIVENGYTKSPVAEIIAKEYLAPLKKANVDTIILGCTHYPLLRGIISDIMGDKVTIIDSGAAAARDVYRRLKSENALADKKSEPQYRFFVSDSPESFSRLGSQFLQCDIKGAEKVQIEKQGRTVQHE